MSTYSDMLDDIVTQAEARLGVVATRDPSMVDTLVAAHGGCVYVQFPVHVGRLLAGPNLEVPVSLVAPAPADLQSVNWLLDHYDDLAAFTGSRSINNGPIEVGLSTYPAITATAQVVV